MSVLCQGITTSPKFDMTNGKWVKGQVPRPCRMFARYPREDPKWCGKHTPAHRDRQREELRRRYVVGLTELGISPRILQQIIEFKFTSYESV